MSKSNKFYAVILAGGQGTRLWPLSRRKKPKQLHPLMTEEPMIMDTYRRLLPVFDPKQIMISTIPDFAADIKKILPEIPVANYIIEPALMGNAAACGLVSEILFARDKQSVAFFMPADAFIADQKEFNRVIKYGQKLLTNNPDKILTVGIKPTRPDVNYGYIKMGRKFAAGVKIESNKVDCFVEKPSLETAKKYFKSGRFLWNSGIFGWRTDHILQLFKKNLPKTFRHLENIRQNLGRSNFRRILQSEYAKVENTSIDYGIIEHTKDILVIPADFGWSDVGTWESLYQTLSDLNNSKIVSRGNHVSVDDESCLVISEKRLIATIGLNDIVVIDTKDTTLICHKDHSHKVKSVIEKLHQSGKHKHL